MTQQELDALPETGGFDYEERVIDGQAFRIPVSRESKTLWTESSEPCQVVDQNGRRWLVGRADGVRYKRALRRLA